MQARIQGRNRWLALSEQAAPGHQPAVINWRTAPLAELFFAADEGETLELELEDRVITATLLQRSLWAPAPGGVLRCWARGRAWHVRASKHFQELPSGTAATALPKAPVPQDVVEVLDEHQLRIVQAPLQPARLVLGEAGFGKTTVAVRRVHDLMRRGLVRRALVLVPTPGLKQLTLRWLQRLNAEQVEVQVFDDWALQRARAAFELPERTSTDTPAGVIRLKRHRALRAVVQDYAPSRPQTDREDLLHLFGDASRLALVRAASQGQITERAVKDTLQHTHVQFTRRSEQEFSHVDAERLETLDGRSLDSQTPWQDADSLDPEDAPVLWALARWRQADAATCPSYDAIVIDEAQEFAPLELEMATHALSAGGELILAGDAHQHMDDTASFVDWAHTLADAGVPNATQHRLQRSHRCPEGVLRWARSLLDPHNPEPWPDDETVQLQICAHACHQDFVLGEALLRLSHDNPKASIVVLYRHPASALAAGLRLSRVLTCRVATDHDLKFSPGVQVTSINQMRGLEADFVVLPDVSADTFPKDEPSRRALYVAFTRARAGLLVLTGSPLSPWLHTSRAPRA